MTKNHAEFWTIDSPTSDYTDQLKFPSTRILAESWADTHGSPNTIDDPKFRGVLEIPRREPSAIVAVDIDEILRQTGAAMVRMIGKTASDMFYPDSKELSYGTHLPPFSDSTLGRQESLHRYVYELTEHDAVPLVPFTGSISNFIASWQKKNVYTLAITACVAGLERKTVAILAKSFLNIRGVYFTGPHEAGEHISKADALRSAVHILSDGSDQHHTIPTIAIDDSSHNARDYAKSGIKTFVPAYRWNEDLEDCSGTEIQRTKIDTVPTGLSAFIAVDQYLNRLV